MNADQSWIRELRYRRGLSQADLAALLHVSRGRVIRMETSPDTVRVSELRALLRLFPKAPCPCCSNDGGRKYAATQLRALAAILDG